MEDETEYVEGPAFLLTKRGIPYLFSFGLQTLAWIIVVASTPDIECGFPTNAEVDYGDIDNGSFFFGMCILGFIMEGIFISLFCFVGMKKLTSIKFDNGDSVLMLNWFSLEVSIHSFHFFFLLLSSILFAAGIADIKDDLNNISTSCDINVAGFVIGLIMVFPLALIALAFLIRMSYLDFRKSGFPGCGNGNQNEQQNETTDGV